LRRKRSWIPTRKSSPTSSTREHPSRTRGMITTPTVSGYPVHAALALSPRSVGSAERWAQTSRTPTVRPYSPINRSQSPRACARQPGMHPLARVAEDCSSATMTAFGGAQGSVSLGSGGSSCNRVLRVDGNRRSRNRRSVRGGPPRGACRRSSRKRGRHQGSRRRGCQGRRWCSVQRGTTPAITVTATTAAATAAATRGPRGFAEESRLGFAVVRSRGQLLSSPASGICVVGTQAGATTVPCAIRCSRLPGP
jgi:hypothetical protein